VRRAARPRRPAPGPPRARADGTAVGGDQQIMLRRAIALGVGVLFLIVIVLAVHGCLSSRHKAALRDYNTRVASIVSDNNASVIAPLFQDLGHSNGSAGPLVQNLQAVEQVAFADAKRADALSAPSEMAHAQSNLELVLNLRAEAIANIAGQVTTALATTGNGVAQQNAIDKITGQMQALLASDVIYSQRVIPQIKQALDDGGVSGQVIRESKSLNNFGWLDNAQVTTALGATVTPRTPGGKLAPGPHGHGLTDVKINGTLLSTGGNNNVSAKAPIFTVDFANQGASNEVDVTVHVSITGPGKAIHLKKTLLQTKAGSPAQVNIPLTSTVPKGPVLVTVTIGKVRGEKDLANNHASYTVTFGG
jgi:hypothetical protein